MRSEAGFNQWAGTTPVTFDIELCVVTGVALALCTSSRSVRGYAVVMEIVNDISQ